MRVGVTSLGGTSEVLYVTNMESFWRWAGPISFAAVVGLLFGRLDFALTQRGPLLLAVSNVGSFWLALAFLVGLLAHSRTHAVMCGVVALFAGMFGYYDALHLAGRANLFMTLHVARPWLVAALFCGACYGLVGYLWQTRRLKLAAVALVAPFVLEPIAWLMRQHPVPPRLSVCLLESVLGLLIGLALLALRPLRPRVSNH
jgi:hypothetical protein